MLKTNYKDDIPSTTNRKYQMINNGDNTVSFNDVTTYTQTGDPFGATDINATNTAVNTNTSDIATINTALNGKVDKETIVEKEVGRVTSPATIDSIFQKIRSGISTSQFQNIRRIRIHHDYTWTDDGKTRGIHWYSMEVEKTSIRTEDEYIASGYKTMIYETLVFRGALFGKSYELAYRYRSYTESGFPNPESYPADTVVYFRDADGNDLSQDKRYVGEDPLVTVYYATT